MSAKYGSRVEFEYEDYGESTLSDHYNIMGYPTVFLAGKPVGLPHDFGFGADPEGKYMPWINGQSQERFATDLEAAVALAIKGESFDAYVREVEGVKNYNPKLPAVTMTSSQGRAIDLSAMSGKIVIIDFWATWCPPCWRTLPALEELSERYGDQLVVITVAVDSPADEMEEMRADLAPKLSAVHATEEFAAQFGSVINVPTMMVYDADGVRQDVLIGAPEDMHSRLEAAIDALIK